MINSNYIFFAPMTGFGGLEIQMVKRAKDNVDRGGKSLYITAKDTQHEAYAKEMNLHLENMEMNFKYLDFITAFKLGSYFRQQNTNICVVAHSSHLSTVVLARNLFKKDVAIIFYQQLESGVNKKDFFHNWIYRNVDGVVVLTDLMQRTIIEKTNINPKKVKKIQYGLDLEKLNPILYNKSNSKAKFNLPDDKFIIGLVGRIEHTKGQLVAVKAFVEANIPNSLLVLCGNIAFQSYFDECFSYAKTNGMEQQLVYIPFTKDIPELMNAFDLFVMPSQSEAFGLVLVEAMASGLPVISTRSGGVPELIEEGYNGYMFNFYETQEFVDKLLMITKNEETRIQLGNNGRIFANERFDYKTQTKTFFEFCDNSYINRNELMN